MSAGPEAVLANYDAATTRARQRAAALCFSSCGPPGAISIEPTHSLVPTCCISAVPIWKQTHAIVEKLLPRANCEELRVDLRVLS
jgi:hypothetical protein